MHTDNLLYHLHHRGSHPISGMFSSPSLIPTRLGILENGHGILGDHRNMYVDFSEDIFMGNELFEIPPPAQRRLQLFDSRTVQRFNNACHKHLLENKIDIKTSNLMANSTFPPDNTLHSDLEAIDDQIGRAIKSADRRCRKLCHGAIPFSEAYRTVRDERRFWILVLRRKYGRGVSPSTIRRLAHRLNVPSPLSIDFIEAKHRLKKTRINYSAFIRTARTERDSFIESLAEANALHNNKPKEKILRRIKYDEEQHIYNSKLKSVYKKSKFHRLDRVIIMHNGHPVEITEPYRVAEELKKMNNSKYSSTNDTPLMHEIYLSSVGYLAEKDGAQDILNGTFGFHIDINPVERQLISRLKHPTGITPIPTLITDDEYQTAWRYVKEKKSSSMSGRHFGVY